MSPSDSGAQAPTLSVVIPSYNSAKWLPSTLDALARAVRAAEVVVEVIVVDDGSTDGTADVVTSLAETFPGALTVIAQSNQGRFIARWTGITRSTADLVLLLDSRVLVHVDALRHALGEIARQPDRVAWNATVITDARAPLVGLFWEVPTHVFWGSYLRSPRAMDLTAENFDRVPKGTTMFLAQRDALVDAFEFAWPQGDARLVSDDTKVLRRIAQTRSIRLDPAFAATYRPRTTVRGFVRHTYDRGTLFVDSYAGTTAARSVILLLLAIAPLLFVGVLIALLVAGLGAVAGWVVVATVVLILLPASVAAVNGCRGRAVWAYVACLPLFVVPFWLGLVRGVVIHRRSFAQSRQPHEGAAPGTEPR
ncbi:hypothetical protein J2Y46_001927 [Microbacterium sp. BE35]|uniref:glycosyltransferase family A protein n=1 Tax=Microbacterium sp. BE35 TaxID=2817773 RepID=UPI00285F106E|nr:glycosyltransferase family A protein [Microbacterium sp. BE35]MDR7189104.1 hypothetical protein [Microbacterium sp. BE35]